MALKCVIPSCQHNTANIVFNFPIPKAKREKWLKALNLDINYEFVEPTGVCELHFKPTYFKKVGPNTLLALNAIPDLYSRDPSESQTNRDGPNAATPLNVAFCNNVAIIQHQPPPPVVIKMEVDDEYPNENSDTLINSRTPIALPMIEPDSIKIEVENPECDVPDPLDPYLDRIQNIQKRNKVNAGLQAKMKEYKAILHVEKRKLVNLKRNIRRNTIKIDIRAADDDKQYNKDLKKISKLREIYFKPELIIPKLIYDRFGIIEYDGLKYPDDLKQFAIELYSKSPIAYDYVRESLCNVIPHPNAILRWTKPQDSLENED